ncbi:methyl-accepting chemotaxis protein [Desulfocucumis palustris]|uniref:Methyl-accepting chemotaxis protein n=1 Tax=Desulfocucumis palustris TaxID=1898651 RepID=A0A2L2XHM8_9FIRM|nr:HAMP domain-containing methyl-accepting chemotaxis protein [Desulfocucumis palustris]GBF35748.1 methyl-accepting chemotaxis protein [Desulfocucumis palustris]
MKVSVGMKIGGGFAILLVLLAIISVQSGVKLYTTDMSMQELSVRSQRISLDYRTKEAFQGAALAIRGYMVYGDEKYLNQYSEQIDITGKIISERLNNSSAESRPKFEEVLEQLGEYDGEIMQNMVPLLKEKKLQEATAVGATIAPITADINETLEGLISENEKKSEKLIDNTISDTGESRRVVLWVSIISLFAGLFLAIFITRSITGPVKVMMSGVKPMAGGDFTHVVEVNTRDELGELAGVVNQTREQLRELVGDIVGVAQSVAAHSQELAASAEQVSATIEEVASATGEVDAMAEKSMENADATAEGSKKVVEVAESGSHTVKRTVDKINAIAKSTDDVGHSIQKLGELSAKVGNITDVITGIADQTNLLALNAAIEAARAGEQGRGFAVVADEVRKLAEQSASAAREIGQLVEQIQTGVDDSTRAMENGAAEVREGVHLAGDAGEALENIIVAISNNISLVEEITLGARQTSQGTQRLSESSGQVSATIQQVAAATQELADIATRLQASVNGFKV